MNFPNTTGDVAGVAALTTHRSSNRLKQQTHGSPITIPKEPDPTAGSRMNKYPQGEIKQMSETLAAGNGTHGNNHSKASVVGGVGI